MSDTKARKEIVATTIALCRSAGSDRQGTRQLLDQLSKDQLWEVASVMAVMVNSLARCQIVESEEIPWSGLTEMMELWIAEGSS